MTFGHVCLVGDDLLRPQSEFHRHLARDGVRLIESVRMDGLRTTEHRRKRLQRGANYVHHRLSLVSVAAAVWAWKRNRMEFAFLAPKCSFIIFA